MAAATKPRDIIEVVMPRLEKIQVQIVGTTPLITHRFSEEAQAGIEGKQQRAAKTAKEARDPDVEWRRGLYSVDGNGVYGIPAIAVKKAIVSAGGRFSDMKMTELRGLFHVMGDLLPIDGSEPEKRGDRVRIGMGKTTMAYRPMFRHWSVRVPVTYNANILARDQLISLFQLAGFAIGIGDWRAECNGIFGSFEVGEVVEI